MDRYLKNFDNCLEREIPYCQGECPFHMEIFNFVEKATRSAHKAAYNVYRNATGFPRIANALCHEPCKEVCPRSEHGGSIEMRLLEKAALDYAKNTSATDYNLPMKKEKIAIVGAGISGMAALLRLSTKKYQVELFEKTDRIGGSLWEMLDSNIFLTDFEEQLAHQEYTLHLNREIIYASELLQGNFDAIYIATGKGGNDFGLIDSVGELGDTYCKKIGNTGVFAGGGLIGDEPLYALANGLVIGTVIDNYIKTRLLYYPKNLQKTKMCKGMVTIPETVPAMIPQDGRAFSVEEAAKEASRCVKCQCSACMEHCDLIQFTEKWPVRMRDEILATTLEGKTELKATPAKRLMSLCNQCGICKKVCPEEIDLDGLFMEGRKKMHRQGKAPWAFHDFWLKDMDFSNSEYASIVKGSPVPSPKSKDNPCCEYAFFPGCQLGASEPEFVKRTYQHLIKQIGDVGLILMCCGVPAEWAGDEEKHQEELRRVKNAWQSLGEPVLILACPNCIKKFKEYLPEIKVISVYEVIAENQSISDKMKGKKYRVFDPCTTTGYDELQRSVRKVATNIGIAISDEGTELPQCCSYGGQGAIANPKYAKFVIEKRINESELPYITYCINCSDNFRSAGKETIHILEALFGGQSDKLATVTERRNNRVNLKNQLLQEFWGEEMDQSLLNSRKPSMKLNLSKELTEKLNEQRILLEEVQEAIAFCEKTKRTIYHEERNSYSGYKEIGFMTLWVEYKIAEGENSYEVLNGYTHRIKIDLEAVWNGKKCETDL